MAIARITSKGQVTIPKEVRQHLGVEAGDALDFHFDESGRIEVVPLRRRRLADFRGIFRVPRALDIAQERALARQARAHRTLEDDRHDNA